MEDIKRTKGNKEISEMEVEEVSDTQILEVTRRALESVESVEVSHEAAS